MAHQHNVALEGAHGRSIGRPLQAQGVAKHPFAHLKSAYAGTDLYNLSGGVTANDCRELHPRRNETVGDPGDAIHEVQADSSGTDHDLIPAWRSVGSRADFKPGAAFWDPEGVVFWGKLHLPTSRWAVGIGHSYGS